MVWIVALGIVCILVCYITISSISYWKKRGVKQDKPSKILVSIWNALVGNTNLTDLLQEGYNSFPESRYTGVYQLMTPVLLIKDPELLKQITLKDFDFFTDHRSFGDPEADPLWTNNLFALKGQRWREMRSTLSPSFTSSKMRILFSLISEAAEDFCLYYTKKDEKSIEVDMKDICTRFTNDVIATAAFGLKVDSLANPDNEFYLMGKDITNFGGFKRMFKFLGYLIFPKIYRILKVPFLPKTSGGFFRRLVMETVRARAENGIVRPDMLNLLLEARKGISKLEESKVIDTGFAVAQETAVGPSRTRNKYITDDELVSQAMIFFFAGFDTVSTTMCFMAYELAVNPKIQEKLREEIKDTNQECNGKLSYEVLLSMKYMDMVISESLRKWPAFAAFDRVCTKPYMIEPTTPDEMPIRIEKGNTVLIPTFPIQRDAKYYPNPEEFNPERFSDSNKDNIKPFTYMPFGLGPRNCIGSRFALLEIKVLFFYMLLNFEITPSRRMIIPLKIGKNVLNLNPEGGFWFELKRI